MQEVKLGSYWRSMVEPKLWMENKIVSLLVFLYHIYAYIIMIENVILDKPMESPSLKKNHLL